MKLIIASVNQLQNNKNKQNYKENNRKMNFYPTQVCTFLSKLKGLIKKISRSAPHEIDSHTQTCHHLIVNLINDNKVLNTFNAQKLRLLAYELVLYLVEVIDARNVACTANEDYAIRNKMQSYLGDINDTLVQIRTLLSKCERQAMSVNGRKSYLQQGNLFSKLENNLSQYQSKLNGILSQFESKKKQFIKSQSSLTFIQKLTDPDQKQDENDQLMQQMHRVIQKKDKKIIDLLQVIKNYEIKIQAASQQLNCCKIHSANKQYEIQRLQQQLKQMTLRNKDFELCLKARVNAGILQAKQRIKKSMSINSLIHNNQVYFGMICSEKDDNSSKMIKPGTEQMITEINNISDQKASTKSSLKKVNSVRSFRRIGYSEDKEPVDPTDKKLKQQNDKLQQLYRALLCQASTIEQIL